MTPTEQIVELLSKYPSEGKAVRIFQNKPDGGRRPITKPNKSLNKWLKHMNKILSKQFNGWPLFMHGGIKKRSYVSYAKPHVMQQCLITIDIRKCFDSISTNDIASSLEEHLKLPRDVCIDLASKLCYRCKLAQGFATSNYISNLYLLNPLTLLFNDLQKEGIVFTNYVDDLAISGDLERTDEIINLVAVSLSRAKLAINKAKIKVMPSTGQQIICGLIVNRRLSLTRALKLKLLSDVANNRISQSSAEGWISNLNSFDKKFRDKFYKFAIKKGLIKTKARKYK